MRSMIVPAVVAICLGIPQVALAQSLPAFDVAGGYAFLQDREIDEDFHGWLASATGRVGRIVGVTGEVGVSDKSLDVLGTTLRFRAISMMGGPRVFARPSERISLFGQVLFGAVRLRTGILDASAWRTSFAWQPGGGADFWIAPAVGIRVGADYRRTVADRVSSSYLRFYAGAVLARD